jgi:hypothetical protein
MLNLLLRAVSKYVCKVSIVGSLPIRSSKFSHTDLPTCTLVEPVLGSIMPNHVINVFINCLFCMSSLLASEIGLYRKYHYPNPNPNNCPIVPIDIAN